MVKIAIPGGAGNVGQEIIDGLVATQKHELVVLSRKDAPSDGMHPLVSWIKVDYLDPKQLEVALQGVHTVLSFAATPEDPTSQAQKNLIDASIKCGVKRFAPCEWASSGLSFIFWYSYKGEIRRYLHDLNKDKKILEYCLFQPGLFTNYLTRPHKTCNHVHMMEMGFDFDQCRIIAPAPGDSKITLTTVRDLVNIVVMAVDYEGEWPAIGGIQGTTVTIDKIIQMGEDVRGKPFNIDKISRESLHNGGWKALWMPKFDHPGMAEIPAEQREGIVRDMFGKMMLAMGENAFAVSDEWNQRFPDYEFDAAEEFIAKVWTGNGAIA